MLKVYSVKLAFVGDSGINADPVWRLILKVRDQGDTSFFTTKETKGKSVCYSPPG